ncbi:RagB/SusD family nutrient uptake outer membrane protein [Bacteroides sp. 51]|uniref:RagB/SusD family nutrient uptake outer membrane protein n=1 Tax=Bacteroides sp. 51 TaxID=2302938 RepID=UPI0013D3BC33|nr:RagB/SusD family nutrient uptake outer membrane protein [Bacteroides sp. 51]NDV82826.1 RagB/SusD family nutrient uptake outer membrane protein [Bacteroides sp. 51]
MKNLIHTLIIGCALVMSLSSCSDYLDVEYIFKDQLSIDTVFSRKDYSEQWLANVYARLSDGENVIVASKGHQPFNFLADDMYYGDRDNGYEFFKNCKYGEGDKQGSWGSCYRGIRDASTYIHNIDKNREISAQEISITKAEARFLRAYFYWLLLRKYGPIPLLPDEGMDHTQEYADLATPRSTYIECTEYIASEMALAAKDLRLDPVSNREITRATKGAALAVRARVYLYAASPLFNGNTDSWAQHLVDNNGKKLLSEQRDEEMWAKAAAAAKEVIDLNKYKLHTADFRENDSSTDPNRDAYPKTIKPPYHPVYSENDFPNGWKNIDPFESYREVFNGQLRAEANEELIFTRGRNQSTEGIKTMVLHQMPRSLNGWNTHGVTLKHANTYYMNDGSDFYAYGKEDPNDGRPVFGYTDKAEVDAGTCRPLHANVSKEYLGREPRFYASIAYNGSVWEVLESPENQNKRYSQIFYNRGSQDGRLSTAPGFYLRTGLGVKKFYHPEDYFYGTNVDTFWGREKPDIDIRYAEILLIYVEALNELGKSYTIPDYLGQSTITVSRDPAEMSKYMSQIRFRGGVPDFGTDVYGDYNKFLKALKRERQIELFAETHRYYDLRRWKDAPEEESMAVWGCNMNAAMDQADLFHRPIRVPSLPNVFVEKMYLWPIDHEELRRNSKLTQNPGWTYYN